MPIVSLEGRDLAGGPLISRGQSFVRCNGIKIIVLHDPVTPHGPGPHAGAIMVGCSGIMRINGIGIVRAGDPASCGHMATGSSNINLEA